MSDERSSHEQPALGEVARHAMDHASMIVRDEVKLARLGARRYVDHLKHDVAPRAIVATAATVCAIVAAISALVALFLAVLWATDSLPWTFLVFAVLFTIAAGVLILFYRRPARVETAEDIERRFPAVRKEAHRTEQALVRQEQPEAHAAVVDEARREGLR